jgi:hypothetical protein
MAGLLERPSVYALRSGMESKKVAEISEKACNC